MNTDNDTLTVASLRSKGYKVDITHLRRTKGKHSKLVQKYEVADHDLINPKGGATVATIVAPDGAEATGRANVFFADTYCKRTGISTALQRAMANLPA